MAPKKISPNRRKSIAGTNQNSPSIVPKGRRRAHSIVPGSNLSPLAKARRSLVPRKSILKAFVNVSNVDPSSQQSGSSSQAPNGDDASATRSIDITQEFSQPVHIHDDTRKSIGGGRRVGFSRESHVRVFDSRRRSSVSQRSSDPPVPPPQAQSDENDYPGGNARRRRSSVRMSMAGSEDMDMTTVIEPGAFQNRGSAILDEEFDFDDEEEYGNDDMDVTEVINGGFVRKRSLSMGERRQSHAPAEAEQSFEGDDESRSDIGNQSAQSIVSDSASERSHIMEFTIPLGQSLRPAQQDDVWLALKQMTHSGGEPDEPVEESFEEEISLQEESGMELDDAMDRLRRARDSLPISQNQEQVNGPQEDSFTNTEDSFDHDDDEMDGNKTLNLSRVLGRPSIGLNSRMSMGYGSNMDESEVYGNIVGTTQSTARQSLAPESQPSQTEETSAPLPSQPQQPRKSLAFQPPPPDVAPQPVGLASQARKSVGTFSFTPRAPSPSKGATESPSKPKPKPTFSAAFAPPVTRPSPKKPPPAGPSGPAVTPVKRPRPSTSTRDDVENMDIDQPSPAKRQALASKWLDAAETPKEKSPSLSPVANKSVPLPAPRPLSPAKKAPFQGNAAGTAAMETSGPRSGLRRPSGYFARRKSMAVSFNVPAQPHVPPISTSGSPKKNPGIGKGRASLGTVPLNPWKRTDKPANPIASKEVSATSESRKEAEVESSVQTTERQASPVPRHTPSAPSLPAVPEERPNVEPISQYEPEPESTDVTEQLEAELSGRMEIDTEATQQWREGIEQAEYDEEEEVPSISVAQFFSITGIKFMDELTAPRRSIYPSQQPLRQARNPAEIPLAEYVTAMAIDIPQLELYSRVSKDLEAWMAKSKVVFAQAEEEAAKVTPELFVEYARADEEGQAELLHQLNLIRTHTRYLARSDWYDWKLQWVEGLRITADEAFASLENDARKLEEPKKTAAKVIPELEKEYEALIRELEQEQAEVAEIEGSDQDYLNELKATIAEQNIEIEALKAELAEGSEQVRWLKERSDEIDIQKREATNTIATAERVLRMKQSSTRSEVFRLKDELEALEDLHMFRIIKVSADVFEYTYSSIFLVTIPCKNFRPIVAKVNIARYGKPNTRYKDDFPKLSAFLLTAAKELIAQGDDDLTVREIVHRLSDYWSSCAQLRSQLTLLGIKYPVEIAIPPMSREGALSGFKARATVMFPSVQAKAHISFVFSPDTFARWPLAVESLDCEVEVAYGPIDRNTVMQAVISRLSQATPSESYACLLDACIEAQDLYH